MKKSFFSPAFLQFFRELAGNNNKDWFDANRKTYENEVKKPFAIFVDHMIGEIRRYEPEVCIKATDAIMRINNDIRFSKDKTLYKTHVAANISRFGKKDKSYPGFYFQFSPEGIGVFGGVYMVDNPRLQEIRNLIAAYPKEFKSVYSDAGFRQKFGEIQGEKNKRIPPEFREALAGEPLVANKQFYFAGSLNADLITSAELIDHLMEYYRVGLPLNEFLKRAW